MTEPLSNMDPWDASASKKQVQVLYWKLNQPVEVGQETKSGFQVFGPSRACVTMKGLLLEKSWIREYFAWVAKSKKLECSQCVVGEDRSPAEEEDRHDQNQHVDHLEERCYDHDHYVHVCNCVIFWKLKKENIIKGQVTFLVSASLLKERGALIICRKENRFPLMNHRNNHEKACLGTFHKFLAVRGTTQSSNVRKRPRFSYLALISV